MQITELFDARSIASQYTEAASNRIPYLGDGLFPRKKKLGLDLKWIKGNKGLPVSLAPSNFDAKSVLRSRVGIQADNTEMAFFRESMLVKEADEQEIMRVQDAADPYAQEVLAHIYDDTNTLLEGADVVPERMIMQLLAPETDGSPRIVIASDGVQYSYNYDPDSSYKTNNYMAIATTTSKWDDHANSNPIADVRAGIKSVVANTGVRPANLLINDVTMEHLVQNENIRSIVLAQNATANIFMTDVMVSEIFRRILNINVIVYDKQYKDESGTVKSFYPNGFATLLPAGALGNTWMGTTPEERASGTFTDGRFSLVNTGVAIKVTHTSDPENTKTTVSEIVLPSYERMNETYVIKAY